MASDDMHVVIFRILAYLYDKMKRGEEPVESDYSAEALGIPHAYWSQVMRQLADRGYVTGVSVTATTMGDVVNAAKPKVTLDGVEYLMENRMMGKAAAFLKDHGGAIAALAVPFL